jgi:thioredoxin 1
MSLATSDATFKTDVLDSPVPALVDFWAPWCGPCRMLGPIMEELSEEAGTKAKIYKLNIDENPKTAELYGIAKIPTVILFRNGKAEKEFVGIQPKKVYTDALDV